MTDTIPNVPRDWIYRVRDLLYEVANETGELGKEAFCIGSFIPDILSAPSPAGVEGLDVVAFLIGGEPSLTPCHVRGVVNEPLCRLSDAKAIIDGLRGENERIRLNIAEYNEAISCYQSERDQQAQRIGELEGLLRHAQKQVPTGSGLHMRIDAALSAVCAAAPNIATTSEHSSQPERDPCPMCIKGGICNTPTCGRLLAMPKAY